MYLGTDFPEFKSGTADKDAHSVACTDLFLDFLLCQALLTKLRILSLARNPNLPVPVLEASYTGS
jgi:hypothetical protein